MCVHHVVVDIHTQTDLNLMRLKRENGWRESYALGNGDYQIIPYIRSCVWNIWRVCLIKSDFA